MFGELITVGDELLSGRTINNNGAHIGHHLRLADYHLRWMTVVGDRENDIASALLTAMERADFVVITGGLGPTTDDRTNLAVARALNRPLRRDPKSWQVISSHLEAHNLSMTPAIAKMAELPKGAERIDLVRPRAGYYIGDAAKPLFFLPGVPDEMADMLADFVLPTLKNRFPRKKVTRSHSLRLMGLRESEIAQRLEILEKKHPTVGFGYYPRFPENLLTLTAQDSTVTAANAALEEVVQAARNLLGLYVYGEGDHTLEMVVGRLLTERGYSLALAESCTGGLIAHLITNVPGSSVYFDRSMVTYSEAAKVSQLLISPTLIDRYGAVSSEVAKAMVRGVQQESKADIALSITGIAGPTGGTQETPVGTVYLALLCGKGLYTERLQFGGDRQKVKLAAAYTALDRLRRAMIDESFFRGK
ncbi:MAG: CinA family nicotinamide mononucleotide deamidase-related protein [Deltaproteobacteria bacterium]|nr:CinA family nicotinamide mononucleotide deamidase-related protein [Deltaproteobacteria bacterium]